MKQMRMMKLIIVLEEREVGIILASVRDGTIEDKFVKAIFELKMRENLKIKAMERKLKKLEREAA